MMSAHGFKSFITAPHYLGTLNRPIRLGELADIADLSLHPDFDPKALTALGEQLGAQDALTYTINILDSFEIKHALPRFESRYYFPENLLLGGWAVMDRTDDWLVPRDIGSTVDLLQAVSIPVTQLEMGERLFSDERISLEPLLIDTISPASRRTGQRPSEFRFGRSGDYLNVGIAIEERATSLRVVVHFGDDWKIDFTVEELRIVQMNCKEVMASDNVCRVSVLQENHQDLICMKFKIANLPMSYKRKSLPVFVVVQHIDLNLNLSEQDERISYFPLRMDMT
jgi:hypothetical protein